MTQIAAMNFAFRIDATSEDGSLGRLINDDNIRPNARMRKICCDKIPRLYLDAIRLILPGDEIRYDYGDGSYPWREQVDCISILSI